MAFVAARAATVAARYIARGAARQFGKYFASSLRTGRVRKVVDPFARARQQVVGPRGLQRIDPRIERSSQLFTQRQFAAARGYARAIRRDVLRAGVVAGSVGAVVGGMVNYGKRPRYIKAGGIGRSSYPEAKRARTASYGNRGHSTSIKHSRRVIGRKVAPMTKVKRIVTASERNMVLSYRGINTLGNVSGLNRGFFSLATNDVDTQWVGFPVHCYNLTAVPQGAAVTNQNLSFGNWDVSVKPGFRLAQKASADADDNVSWLPDRLNGQTNDTGGALSPTWNLERLTDATDPSTIGAVGRHCYNDWISAKFMIWGKRRQDTRIMIRLVKFNEDFYCPEYGQMEVDNVLNKDAQAKFVDAMKSMVKPLINNPIASRMSVAQTKPYTVLYSKYIHLPPNMTDDQNDDPQAHQFDLFYRVNKLMDHSDARFGAAEPGDDGEDIARLQDERYVPPSGVGFRAQPKRLRDNIYMLITSWDPFTWGTTAPTSEYSASYDMNLRRKVTLELV